MNEKEKKKALKLWLAVIGVFVLCIAVFSILLHSRFYVETWSGDTSDTAGFEEGDKKQLIVDGDEDTGGIGDHVRGKSDSSVIFIEYADMQCPGCAMAMEIVDELYDEYKDRVAFVFRHFPLSSHENAKSAAMATESAAAQGYFWEMMEALYGQRATWISLKDDELTEQYVEIFKMVAPNGDEAAFRDGLKDENAQKKVNADYKRGRDKDKVSATPSFYVNGLAIDISKISTWSDMKDALKSALDTALEANSAN